MRTKLVFILLFLSFSFGRELKNNQRIRRAGLSAFAIKCTDFIGYRPYEVGTLKLCIYHSGFKTTYFEAVSFCKQAGSRLALLDTRLKRRILSKAINVWANLLDDERCHCFLCEPVLTLEMCRTGKKLFLCEKVI
ncbi:hypothetical protein Bpfe_012787 [Biomphalaria pfeifferi]|uniref:C-type lectin domain-containing protein n=1 Tax=Biomphalaria pfeifferi TaxID=112525 RepID=A0AAD8FBY6_BIOPF|nr:hypothetical protein Bpfe_012787 [Biomphalaria pfeifferi]